VVTASGKFLCQSKFTIQAELYEQTSTTETVTTEQINKLDQQQLTLYDQPLLKSGHHASY